MIAGDAIQALGYCAQRLPAVQETCAAFLLKLVSTGRGEYLVSRCLFGVQLTSDDITHQRNQTAKSAELSRF